MLTLDEELFLISRDPRSGRDRSRPGVDTALGGAVLMVLARLGAVTVVDGLLVDGPVVADRAAVLPRPHLRVALDLIAADSRRPKHWIRRLPAALQLQERIGVELAERGILADGRSRFLGLTVKRFPDVDPSPRREIEARVVAALTGADPEPDADTRLLAGLVGAADLVRPLVGWADRYGAGKRATRFLREAPVGDAVSSVAASQRAVAAALRAAVRPSSSSSSFPGGGGGGGDQ